jgi:hypothetical protein
MSLVTLPRQLIVDINGEPRVGARMFVYDASTNNTRTAYTGRDYTTEHVQPIQAAEGGIFPVVEVNPAGGAYKLVIQDADGAVIYTADNLVPSVDELTQSNVGSVLYPRTDDEVGGAVTPTKYSLPQGYSERYGESDASAFGGNHTAMHALKPFPNGAAFPQAYGGFVVNAPYGRFNIGSNWTSATGFHRQMYASGYATMIQGDENGDIGFYTYGTSVPAGQDWQPKYSLILRANGTQLCTSNGANHSWWQDVSTGANTNDQGFGTPRLTWGCAAAAGELIAGTAAGDVVWVNQTVGKTFQWSCDQGANWCMTVGASNFYLRAANAATSVSWEYRIGSATKGYIGFSGSAGGIISNSVDGDAVIRSGVGFRVSTNDGTSAALVANNSGAVFVPLVGTTASAANCFLDNAASNSILRSTSSLRYKTNVRPLEDAEADRILSMNPIRFSSLCAADNPNWTYYGLAAEEVAAIDPRYAFFDGEGRPDGVQYDRLVVPLLQIVKRQSAEIAALKEAIAGLQV